MALKTCVIYDVDRYEGDWPSEQLGELIAWLGEKLESIPPECRDSATCEIGSISGYEGSHYATICIQYRRPETDEEIAQREVEEAFQREYARQCELDTLSRLKAKYEGGISTPEMTPEEQRRRNDWAERRTSGNHR